MYSFVKIGTLCAIVFPMAIAAEEVLPAERKNISNINEMFEEGKVSGEARSMYAGYDIKGGGADIYSTAVGGHIKYESAELNNFSVGAAFAISHDIGFASGEKGIKQNPELSSSRGEYTTLSQAYLNYANGDFNFRAGRQLIDTPLADSDDIRMIANTFEAYIATYSVSNLSFTAGNLQRWQGYDAGLDSKWVKAGEDGTWFGGISYSDDFIEASGWYYNITKLTNASYMDLTLNYEVNSDISVSAGVQYLNEREINNSGVKADIYGAMAELSAYGIKLGAAYNKSQKKSSVGSFSGFGGGALFTSMDTMILDAITPDRDAQAITGNIGCEIDDLTLVYAYGDFNGDADGLGAKAHIVEQNIGAEYSIIKDKLLFRAIYAVQEDKESVTKTDFDWKRLEFMVSYIF